MTQKLLQFVFSFQNCNKIFLLVSGNNFEFAFQSASRYFVVSNNYLIFAIFTQLHDLCRKTNILSDSAAQVLSRSIA